VRRKAILAHFKSVAQVRSASVEELEAVSGIGRSIAETIHLHFHQSPHSDVPNKDAPNKFATEGA
jgi:excinuclease ABC subunit C